MPLAFPGPPCQTGLAILQTAPGAAFAETHGPVLTAWVLLGVFALEPTAYIYSRGITSVNSQITNYLPVDSVCSGICRYLLSPVSPE